MTSATPAAASTSAAPGALQTLLAAMEREHATTVRVLRAFPADRLDLQPHPKSKPARDLAWLFVQEQGLVEKAITTGFDWSAPPAVPPPMPETLDEIVEAFEAAHGRVMAVVRGMSDEDLRQTVQFFVAPKTLGDIPKIDFLWFLLHDQIHHRGQFSVYLRMADARVPSIYGPTADEPWF
jgi:uncharacterized damage-inducible protein DinB